jgi:hypothetical protein
MTFKSGMVLVGSKQALEEHVELPEEDKCAAQEPVVLKDSIERLLTGT